MQIENEQQSDKGESTPYWKRPTTTVFALFYFIFILLLATVNTLIASDGRPTDG
jgi:hypothetical protein